MNYFVLIIVAIIGVALGMYIARRKANAGFIAKQMERRDEGFGFSKSVNLCDDSR